MEQEQKNNEKIVSNKTNVKLVKTYAEDMAEVIGDNREGLIKKIIEQDEVNEIEKLKTSSGSKENKFFIVMGSLLILATMAIVVISTLKKSSETVFVEKPFTPLIFNDKTTYIEVSGLNKDKIIEAVYNAFDASSLKASEVEGIYLTENKKLVGLRRFIELTKGAFVIPESIEGGGLFVSDDFLLGVNNNEFFILIKISSLSDVFNNMRAWEQKMFTDLYRFFGINLSSETEYLLTKDFENGIIENKNARILYGENKDVVMMYVFANNTSLVITKSPFTAREVLLRLASSQIKK